MCYKFDFCDIIHVKIFVLYSNIFVNIRNNYIFILQFSLMEHFYHNKSSSLCCPEFDIEHKIQNLKNEELQFLKRLPSVEQ